MKIKKPEEEIEVCDICQCGGYLKTCIVCHGQYCLSHQAILPGSYVQSSVCEKCGKRDEVMAVIDRFRPTIKTLVDNRNADLSNLANAQVMASLPTSKLR
jgi:hypothetical protein